ncbi:histidine phosphatase family protein [Glaciihabitans arcticus]|uniref:Histidine phosphatase family protein n=1 Tax=Glaciihabitans arcticus TaxID=2668039 RepID=A0A4Q9GSS1_9MICO|nr:histidine phosphatase family protein [Glaciihabitans arcticus]TBN56668.1 histidine phosphatase family protein [Glaciihabitans arcticus]
MTLIYLVRHGETDWNLARRIQGSTDIDLNDTGRAQALATGRLLARRDWDAIVSSPLSRARETAQIIAAEVGLGEPELVPALAERQYGAAEGLDYTQIDALFPGDTEVPGRETREEVTDRVLPAIVALAEAHPDKAIIVVSHGGVIRSVLSEIAPDDYQARDGRIRNGSIHSFAHTDGTLDLIMFDDPIEIESLDCATDDLVDQNALESREAR